MFVDGVLSMLDDDVALLIQTHHPATRNAQPMFLYENTDG